MKNKLPLLLSLWMVNAIAQEETEGLRAMRLSCVKHKVALGCFNYANMLQRREIGEPDRFYKMGCELKHEPSCNQDKWDLPALENTVSNPKEEPVEEKKEEVVEAPVIKADPNETTEITLEDAVVDPTATELVPTDKTVDAKLEKEQDLEKDKDLEKEKLASADEATKTDEKKDSTTEESKTKLAEDPITKPTDPSEPTVEPGKTATTEPAPAPTPAPASAPAASGTEQPMRESYSTGQPAVEQGEVFKTEPVKPETYDSTGTSNESYSNPFDRSKKAP